MLKFWRAVPKKMGIKIPFQRPQLLLRQLKSANKKIGSIFCRVFSNSWQMWQTLRTVIVLGTYICVCVHYDCLPWKTRVTWKRIVQQLKKETTRRHISALHSLQINWFSIVIQQTTWIRTQAQKHIHTHIGVGGDNALHRIV